MRNIPHLQKTVLDGCMIRYSQLLINAYCILAIYSFPFLSFAMNARMMPNFSEGTDRIPDAEVTKGNSR